MEFLRPCISTIIPKENGEVGILSRFAGYADCKSDVLYQFGVLGSFCKTCCGISNPKVGECLNLGEEKTKGNMSPLNISSNGGYN